VLLSVVIPTRDRPRLLRRNLDALAAQRPGGEDRAELIVVVDRAAPARTASELRALAGEHPLPLTVLDGPAGSRKAGAERAAGDVILFLNDDTRPADERLLAGHLALHRAHPEAAYAVLGHTAWAPELEVSPLMRWLESGPQFNYAHMRAGTTSFLHFYTCHVSIKPAALRAVGGFDERLPFYWEDTELAARLADWGMRLDYHPELVVHHHHPTTLDRWCERQRISAHYAPLLRTLRPELVSEPAGPRWGLVRAAGAALRLVGGEWGALPRPARELVYEVLDRAAFQRGWREGARRTAAGGGPA
jgi:GT2 family glycosyltransferase